MIEIDYNESATRKLGDFGYELSVITGKFNGKHFKIFNSNSSLNSKACVEGNLTSAQTSEIIKNFEPNKCCI